MTRLALFLSGGAVHAGRMGSKRLDDKPADMVHFLCPCGHKFEAVPGRVEDAEDRPWHPWGYFAVCYECGEEAAQDPWEVNIFKAHSHATGPKTPEGRAASAANLSGHPTPQEARLTRLNAMKHGAYAKTAMFFPARPGKYPQCENCAHLDDKYCEQFSACLIQTEVFVKFTAAFEKGDPDLIRELIGHRQAALFGIMDQMIFAIAKDGGPQLVSPTWHGDKDGNVHFVKYPNPETGEADQLFDHSEHPLLKRLIDLIAKNNMALADMNMTPKAHDEQDMMQGFLQNEDNKQENALEFQTKMEKQVQGLEELIRTSMDDSLVIDITEKSERV